jgi:putative N6-adenine-specific DNA methylase
VLIPAHRNKKDFNLDTFFAVTVPGLEPFTAQELRALDLQPVPEEVQTDETGKPALLAVQTESGGVSFKGDLASLYRANLHLRTASRILARLGNFFRATTFPELHLRLARLPWERFLTPGQPVSIRVTCHKSRLNHTDLIARTVSASLAERLGKASPTLTAGEETDGPTQLVVVRLSDDRVTVSVDSSGTLLYKRGYRLAVAKAPLRETLAAGLLLASGWDKVSPLLDPFCGSGTIAIEAALMALAIPPGINRRFAFMDWPGYDQTLWQGIAAGWQKTENAPPPILASDRDAGAIKMSQANAERAGVARFIEFKCQAVSYLSPPAGRGWIVTNPPYGMRVSQGKDLRNLYAQFGNVLRDQCPGWNLSVLCSDPVLLGQMQVKLDTSLALANGGISVRLGRGVVK